jgi:RimJ/RimL family protein N-acetyltransferase
MKPLDPHLYPRIEPLLRAVPINTLFARAVVERHVPGAVYVDDEAAPGTVYVAHPYGMSLLFGRADNDAFNARLLPYLTGEVPRRGDEWLQVYPDPWQGKLAALLGERLVSAAEAPAKADPVALAERPAVLQDVRVNFGFDRRAYGELRQSLQLPAGCAVTTDAEWIYRNMEGSVVPRAFWDSAEAFEARGAATGLLCDGALASVAFASFVFDDCLELGIETLPAFRGRGFAIHACAALIDLCLRSGLEPVWSCRMSNLGSYRLARRLGFEHTLSIPYYRLPS